ncbi:hypothetical protein ACPC54_37525 [Kitasatospora sp. NPDC094028]
MTTSQPLGRGISAVIPGARAATTPGERAAAQLQHLRTATVPIPLLTAAAELIAPQLESEDPVTREAAGSVRALLLAAAENAAPE